MEPVLQAVADYLNDRSGVELIENPLAGVCQLAVRTEGIVAFFRETTAAGLLADWEQTQSGIAAAPVQEFPYARLYLTLLVTDLPEPLPEWQGIVRDMHVCRKVIVPTFEHRVADWVDDLPFLPLPDEVLKPRSVITPGHALYRAGFSVELAERLLGQSSVASVGKLFREQRVRRAPDDAPPAEVLLEPRRSHRRLHRLEVENFRPFARTLTLPEQGALGDLTVIYGPNGSGKSSLAQAIEWGVVGRVEALEADHADAGVSEGIPPYINVYHRRHNARVSLVLCDQETGVEQSFERQVRPSGAQMFQGTTRGSQAEALVRVLDANLPVVPHVNVLTTMARQSHFLDQETIRDFLSRSATDRYQAMANMIGTVDYERALKKLRQVQAKENEALLQAERLDLALEADLSAQRLELDGLEKQLRHLDINLQETFDLPHLADELRRTAGELGLVLKLEAPDRTSVREFAEELRSGVSQVVATARDRMERLKAAAHKLPAVTQAEEQGRRLREKLASASQVRADLESQLHVQSQALAKAEHDVFASERALSDAEDSLRESQEWLTRVEQLAEAAHDLAKARKRSQKAEQVYRKALTAEQTAAEKAETAENRRQGLAVDMAEWRQRRDALAEMNNRLPRVLAAQTILERLGPMLAAADNRIGGLKTTRDRLENEALAARQRADSSGAVLMRIQGRVAGRQQLLSAMSVYLDNDRCPLCNTKWESAEKLYSQVQAMLTDTPEELLLAQQTVQADEAELGRRTDELEQVSQQLRVAVADRKALDREQDDARSLVQEWSDLGADAGMRIPSPLVDPAALVQLEQAQLERTDRSAALTEAEAVVRLAGQALREARTRLDSAVEERDQAGEELSRAESDYEYASSRAPQGINRPAPTPQQIRTAQSKCRQWEDTLAERETAHRGAQVKWKAAGERFAQLGENLSSAQERAEQLEAAIGEQQRPVQTFAQTLLGLGLDSNLRDLTREITQTHVRLGELDLLAERARWFDGAIHARALQENIAQVQKRTNATQNDLQVARKDLGRHQQALDLIATAEAALNTARAEEQYARLAYYEPTINEIYQRLNPHPFFPELKWRPSVRDSELTMHAVTHDGSRRVPVQQYFSMAQSNVVALSVFLGSALLQSWSGLRLLCIDDPVQQMDDLNTVAFLDVIQAVVERKRQVVLTTANKEFYQLLLRRYAYMNRETPGRFRAFRLRTVNPKDGPDVAEDTPVFMENGRVRLGVAH